MEERRRGERRASGNAPPVLFLVPQFTGSSAVRIALGSAPVLIGRDASSHLRDQSADVSRFHCRVDARPGIGHVLTDTGSSYGTWVDGERVTGEVVLRPGQVIGIGENGCHRIRVEVAKLPAHLAPSLQVLAQRGDDAHREHLRTLLAQVESTLDLEASLRRAIEVVGATLDAERVFLMLEEEGELVRRASNEAIGRLAEEADIPLPALRRAMARRDVRQWIPFAGADDEIERSLLARGVTAAWFLPLPFLEDEPAHASPARGLRGAGVVYADTRAPAPLRCDEATLEFLAALADIVALQLANARLHYRATHDRLTGLRNRSWFDERLDRLMEKRREGAGVAVVMADIDYFRLINDTWGHEAGDDVLREVAERFRATAGALGTTCRHGGEELVVLLPDGGVDTAAKLADALRVAVAERPIASRDREGREIEIEVTASFGVAELDPSSMPRRSDFVKAADQALQQAKADGRNRVERHGAGSRMG